MGKVEAILGRWEKVLLGISKGRGEGSEEKPAWVANMVELLYAMRSNTGPIENCIATDY